jgi:Ca2+-binding EF-hand superfamily protein
MTTRSFIFGTVLLALTVSLLPAIAQAQSVEHPARLIQRLDMNHDGALDRTEFRAARNDKFQAADMNEDGAISRGEFEAVVARFRALHGLDRAAGQTGQSPVFDRVDLDGDGLVTQEEFNAAADRMFARLDRDDDGLLTVEDGFEG